MSVPLSISFIHMQFIVPPNSSVKYLALRTIQGTQWILMVLIPLKGYTLAAQYHVLIITFFSEAAQPTR